ncbi:hypothetical protein D3C74_412330 [compost metagenome]
MSMITPIENREAPEVITSEDTVSFLVPLFSKLLKGGKLHALLNSTLAEARRILADGDYESSE